MSSLAKQKKIQLSGTVSFDAPLEQTWTYLTTPEKLSHCVPGLIQWHEADPNRTFHLKLAWFSQTKAQMVLPIAIEWNSLTPPTALSFSARAKPSASNLILATGDVAFTAVSPQETEVVFTAVIQTPNPFLDQIIKNILPTQIDQFISCLKTNL